MYGTWSGIIQRCTNPSQKHYNRYGGRGITIYEPWLTYSNFKADVVKEIGERPRGLSMDRINSNGNYEPGNIRWANQTTQNRNKDKCVVPVGERFGHLTVLGLDHRHPIKGCAYWKCRCECGNTSVHRADGIRRGAVKTCRRCDLWWQNRNETRYKKNAKKTNPSNKKSTRA